MLKKNLCSFTLYFVLAILPFSSCKKSISLNYDSHLTITNTNDTLYSFLGKKTSGKLSDKLLIFLQGSEQQSLRRLFGYAAEASQFGYDILLINKFAYNDNNKYWQTNCQSRRVDDICSVANYIKENVYHNSLKAILILGESEGGGIAPLVAQKLPIIKQMILMGSGGLPQSKEFEILLSKGFNRGNNFFRSNGIMNLSELKQKLDEIIASTHKKARCA